MFALAKRLVRPLEFTGRGGYFELCRLAYPLIIQGAGNTVMQFIDRKFLASLSPLDVAASMPAGALNFMLFCLFLSTCGFTSAIVAQYHGAGDRRMVLKSVWSGVYFALFAALVIVFLLPLLGQFIIASAGDFFAYEPALTGRMLDYYIAMVPSGAFACLAVPFFGFFSGRGKTVPVAVINIIGCGLNVVLDYAFIFGWGPIPAMGIYGAGIATSICAMLTMVIVVVYFLMQNQDEYPTRRERRPVWSCVVRLVKFGFPAGMQLAFDMGAWVTVNFTVGYLGALPLAAHVVAVSINGMFFIPLLGLSEATAILVGQYIGRAKHAIAGKLAFRSWRLSLCYMLLGGVVYMVFPVRLAEFFSPSENPEAFLGIIPVIRLLLFSAACFNLSDTMKFIFAAALRGAGDTRAVMTICLACGYLVMLPGVLLLIFVFEASVVAVWLFLTFTATLEGALILNRFRTGKWRHIRLIAPPGKIRQLDERGA